MNHLVPIARANELPVIVTAAGEPAQLRFLEFFAASIRNAHTRRAYLYRPLRPRERSKGGVVPDDGRGTERLTKSALAQSDAHAMISRRASAGAIKTRIGNHTFRATGITAYLKNGGQLETAAAMANHASPRTTQLYDRRSDEVSLDEIERVRI